MIPSTPTALTMLAQIAASERNWAEAKDYLERARSAHADALPPRVALARVALATNDLSLAQTAAAEALALDPNNLDALTVHAQALLATDDRPAAESDVNKVHELIGAADPNARALALVANLQRQVGQLDRAKANLERAVAKEPNSVDALIALVQLNAQQGDAAAAKRHLDALATLAVDQTQLTLLRADVAAATGNLDAAMQGYRTLAQTGNRDATLKLAATLDRAGKLNEAMQVVAKYLDGHDDDFAAGMTLAGYALKQGDRAGAAKRYESLLAKHGDNAVVLNNLAWLYFEAKDPRATDTARRAYALAPRNPAVADTLGWILVQKDSALDEAVRYLEAAAGAEPDNASIQYHVAVVYEKLNRHTEARRAIDRALKDGAAFPEQPEAQALRTRL